MVILTLCHTNLSSRSISRIWNRRCSSTLFPHPCTSHRINCLFHPCKSPSTNRLTQCRLTYSGRVSLGFGYSSDSWYREALEEELGMEQEQGTAIIHCVVSCNIHPSYLRTSIVLLRPVSLLHSMCWVSLLSQANVTLSPSKYSCVFSRTFAL